MKWHYVKDEGQIINIRIGSSRAGYGNLLNILEEDIT